MALDLFEKYLEDQESVAVMNGLLVAQLICSRRMLDAFDGMKSGTELISLIMSDISNVMERVRHGNFDSNTDADLG